MYVPPFPNSRLNSGATGLAGPVVVGATVVCTAEDEVVVVGVMVVVGASDEVVWSVLVSP